MDFDEQSLKAALTGKDFGMPLHFYQDTSSTNVQAFRLAEEGAPEGTVVIADSQTQGKGRLRRQWFSPPGANLYVSVVLRPALTAAAAAPLTIMAGVAVAAALSSFCLTPLQLKWPNDVLLNQRKVAGILMEMKTRGKGVQFVVLGVGVNINMKKAEILPLLAPIATSLCIEAGREFSRLAVAVNTLTSIGSWYQAFLRQGVLAVREAWLGYAQVLDRTIEATCGNEIIRGRVTGMDEGGALTIRTAHGGSRRIIVGDTFLIKD